MSENSINRLDALCKFYKKLATFALRNFNLIIHHLKVSVSRSVVIRARDMKILDAVLTFPEVHIYFPQQMAFSFLY